MGVSYFQTIARHWEQVALAKSVRGALRNRVILY